MEKKEMKLNSDSRLESFVSYVGEAWNQFSNMTLESALNSCTDEDRKRLVRSFFNGEQEKEQEKKEIKIENIKKIREYVDDRILDVVFKEYTEHKCLPDTIRANYIAIKRMTCKEFNLPEDVDFDRICTWEYFIILAKSHFEVQLIADQLFYAGHYEYRPKAYCEGRGLGANFKYDVESCMLNVEYIRPWDEAVLSTDEVELEYAIHLPHYVINIRKFVDKQVITEEEEEKDEDN